MMWEDLPRLTCSPLPFGRMNHIHVASCIPFRPCDPIYQLETALTDVESLRHRNAPSHVSMRIYYGTGRYQFGAILTL